MKSCEHNQDYCIRCGKTLSVNDQQNNFNLSNIGQALIFFCAFCLMAAVGKADLDTQIGNSSPHPGEISSHAVDYIFSNTSATIGIVGLTPSFGDIIIDFANIYNLPQENLPYIQYFSQGIKNKSQLS